VVLYGCETSSDIKGGTKTKGVWEQGVEENIWIEEVWSDGRLDKLHNEKLHNLYSLPRIIRMIRSRRMRWAPQVTRKEKKRNAYRILVEKPEEKRLLGRPRHRWWIILKRILDRMGVGTRLWFIDQSTSLQIQRSRVRFPALTGFLISSGSGTGSTQPREYNWGATWKK
jgi:hypothetical protein